MIRILGILIVAATILTLVVLRKHKRDRYNSFPFAVFSLFLALEFSLTMTAIANGFVLIGANEFIGIKGHAGHSLYVTGVVFVFLYAICLILASIIRIFKMRD
jgi:hypothetical protein